MANVNKDGVVITSSFMMQNRGSNFVEKDFDQDYLTIKIVDKVIKVGEDDYSIIKQVLTEKKPIQEVIDADAEGVGVYNIIKQVLRTGDTSLLPVDKGDCNVDLVGAPESLMDIKNMGTNAEKAYSSLPEELTKGMDMKAFVDSLTQEQFDAFISSMAERASGSKKEEVTSNGE